MKEKKPKKITMKERILQFVESKGSARFTDIQRFIVEFPNSPGLYDQGKHFEHCYTPGKMVGGKYVEGHRIVRLVNSYRGTYCMAFTPGKGYLMLGRQYLEKRNKLYYAVRDGVWKPTPKRWRSYRNYTSNRCKEEIISIPDDMARSGGTGKCYDSVGAEVKGSPAPPIWNPLEYRAGLQDTGNFDNCDIKIVQIENDSNNNCIVEPKVSEPFVTAYNKKEDLSLVFDQLRRHIDSFSGGPLPRMEKSIEPPKYCRWCGHGLHESQFKSDNNGFNPTHCQWCGHTL